MLEFVIGLFVLIVLIALSMPKGSNERRFFRFTTAIYPFAVFVMVLINSDFRNTMFIELDVIFNLFLLYGVTLLLGIMMSILLIMLACCIWDSKWVKG